MTSIWEKGVVIGKTANSERYFVSSSYDTLIMYKNDVGSHELGDCVKFIATRLSNPHEKATYERQIIKVRKCTKFVQFEQEYNKNSCLLICDIVRVRVVYHEESDSMVRMLRTDFLEEVLDTSPNCYTYSYTDEELLKMRVVCKRVVNMKSKKETWAVLKLRQNNMGNNEANANSDLDDREPLLNDKIKTKIPDREVLCGFVATVGTTKNGKDELYIWVPFRKKDLYFPASLRTNKHRGSFIGRWLTFSVNERGALDDLSDVQILNNDHLPTRRRANRNEVLVPCSFRFTDNDEYLNPMLNSKMCGPIVDACSVLRRYNRLNRSFDGNAWVYNFLYDNGVRFVLSDLQDEWGEQDEIAAEEDFHRESGHRSRSMNRSRYTSEYEDDEIPRSFRENRSRSRHTTRETRSSIFHVEREDDFPRSVSQNGNRRESFPVRSDIRNNGFNDEREFENYRSDSQHERRRDSFPARPDSRRNDFNDERGFIRGRSVSRHTNRRESLPARPDSRRNDFNDERDFRDYHIPHLTGFGESSGRRSRMRSISNQRDANIELSSEYGPRMVDRKIIPDFDDEDSFDSEDGDSTLIPRTSEPVQRNLQIRPILKKTELERLNEELERLQSQPGPIPEEIAAKLLRSIMKEQQKEEKRMLAQKKQEHEAMERRREEERIEELEFELLKNKNVVELIREIMASQKVRDAMRSYDSTTTMKLCESLCNL